MSHLIKLVKVSQRTLAEDVIGQQLRYAVSRVLSAGRDRTWAAKAVLPASCTASADGYLYTAGIKLKRTGRAIPAETEEKQVEAMRGIAEAAIRSKGWFLEQGEQRDAEPDEPVAEPVQPAQLPNVEADYKPLFADLYSLDNQIELVMSSVREFFRTEGENRFNVVLHGDPGCGKTAILQRLTEYLGKANVLHLDATATTAAGMRQMLLEAADVPPVVAVEEIEKAGEDAFKVLLGLMDSRGEVRSLKFRAGLRARNRSCLVLATVNNMAVFGRMMEGALASRFPHKIMCPRPTKAVLEQILQRELEKTGGNRAWITPAVDYCVDVEQTNDPRRVIAVCLCGRERLLTGQYQAILRATA